MGVKTREHPGIFRRKFTRPDGTVYEGKVWWVQYWKDGRPYQESSKSERLADAKTLLKKREGQIVEGHFSGLRPQRVTVAELAEGLRQDYRENKRRSLETVEYRLEHVLAHLGQRRAADLTTAALRDYIRQRQEEQAENATINRELAAVHKMLKLAAEADPPKVTLIPKFPHLQENAPRAGFFEPEEVERLLPHLPADLRPFVAFAHETGWRKAEVANLTLDRMNLQAGVVWLDPGMTKNREPRKAYLSGTLVKILTHLKEQRDPKHRDCPFVFHRGGEKVGDIRKAWAHAIKQAEIPDRPCHGCQATGLVQGKECLTCKGKGKVRPVFHDLRRSAVRDMIRAGVPKSVAKERSGHKTDEVFNRYNITSDADQAEAAKRIERYMRRRRAVKSATIRATTPAPGPLASAPLDTTGGMG